LYQEKYGNPDVEQVPKCGRRRPRMSTEKPCFFKTPTKNVFAHWQKTETERFVTFVEALRKQTNERSKKEIPPAAVADFKNQGPILQNSILAGNIYGHIFILIFWTNFHP
jgi:hypothetical protein